MRRPELMRLGITRRHMAWPARGWCVPAWLLAVLIGGVSLPTTGSAAAPQDASASSPEHSGSLGGIWSDLWWNRDQQGQRLLESGDAAAAAQRFRDPRRQAYADLTAGRYRDAAQLLARFKDPESQYNLGNALARSGQLPAALRAYDTALAQAPRDRDARHNRNLVARALAQQAKKPQPPQARGQQGQAGRRQGQQGRQGQQEQQGQHGQQARQGGAQHSGSAGSQNTGQLARTDSSGSQPAGVQRTGAQRSSAAQRAGQGPASTQSPLLAQAQPATPAQNKPESEQALSLAQWLRRLPDDPGELLRRKFLIEHLMRQQGGQ